MLAVQPVPTFAISLRHFRGQIKHCAVGSLPVLFSSFPCKLTLSSILPRPSRRDALPRHPFGSLDTLLLMVLSAESYDRLLNWLHPNRVEAEKEYLRIRKLLVKHFQAQDCSNPEQLADATVDRAAEKLTTERVEEWDGVKERYFYRVAFYILKEDQGRRKRFPEIPIPDGLIVMAPDEKDEDNALRWDCLQKCLQQQPSDKRELVIRYYRGMTANKIKNRAELAQEYRLTLPKLRVKAHRIRLELRTCIERCVENAARKAIFQSNQTLPL